VGTSSQDHTLALEAIYAPNWQWELYGKYALRSSSTQLDQNFSSSSVISLAQLRATYRFARNFDFVGETRWISQTSGSQPRVGYSETGAVAELGYYLTPDLRLAAGYSFGNINDRDFGGSRAAGGAYLGLTVKVNELFDGFGLQKIAPPQQQESQLAQAPPAPASAPVQPAETPKFFAPQGISFVPPGQSAAPTVLQVPHKAEIQSRADLVQPEESAEALGTLEEIHIQ
jgi:hypothetical protein